MHAHRHIDAGRMDREHTAILSGALAFYRERWPEEAATCALFVALLGDARNPFVRERLQGHFTASAWLVSADGHRLLMTHHRKLGRWLQLGGHADGERDLVAAALKEAQEESGLRGLRIEPAVFDLDRHWIPQYKEVPGHWHYDLRFVVHAGESEAFVVSDESHDLAWRDIAVLAEEARTEPSYGGWRASGCRASPVSRSSKVRPHPGQRRSVRSAARRSAAPRLVKALIRMTVVVRCRSRGTLKSNALDPCIDTRSSAVCRE